MKHIKLFEAFLTIKKPNYKKPEFEFKEFYRSFKAYPELKKLLPSEIDRSIFEIKADGFGENLNGWRNMWIRPANHIK